MQAITYARYGGPEGLRLEDVATPKPGPGQVRLRVRAASVNPYEFHFVRGEPLFMRLFIGLRRPKVGRLGRDVAGVVDAVGPDVDLEVGDAVFGSADGSYAEYAVADCDRLAHKPDGLSFEAAAALPMAGYTGLQGLDAAEVQPGDHVLVNGASGGIGHLVVQMAKNMGAHVTATCATRNCDWVAGLGADRVIDYTKRSYLDDPGRYDAIIDAVANHPVRASLRTLKPTGRYVWLGAAKMGKVLGPMPRILGVAVLHRRATVVNAKGCRADLERMAAWVAEGRLQPRLDQVVPLQRVGEGLAHVERGHTQGKTVVTVP